MMHRPRHPFFHPHAHCAPLRRPDSCHTFPEKADGCIRCVLDHGALMRKVTATGIAALAALLLGACDDRRERIEETAAPGMEADAAAPASGPVDLDVDTIDPDRFEPLNDTARIQPQRLPPVTPEGQQPPPEPQDTGGR
jgi:hypothetical protein